MPSPKTAISISLTAAIVLTTAAHALEFSEIRLLRSGDRHTIHVTVTNDVGQVNRFAATYDSRATTSRFFNAVQSYVTFDKTQWSESPEMAARPWAGLSGGHVGPVLVLVPYSAADEGVASNLPALFPEGFGSFQDGGPRYSFYAGKYEVSNAEFVQFLNDAQVHSNDARGAFMFFDPEGVVRFNPAGEDDGPRDYNLFDPSKGRVVYVAGATKGERYAVTAGFEQHPVVGVSWYGAIKYCNWLTLYQGMGESERCYAAGFNPDDWRPITASNWPAQFTSAERLTWVTEHSGYRLPMLQDSSGPQGAYNEFYKAAAWTGLSNTLHGFGRTLVTPGDANYLDSGDPFEPGTTPGGYYDGITKADFPTAPNENRGGIHDLSGNVGEWLTDWVTSSSLWAFAGVCFLNGSDRLFAYFAQEGLPRGTFDFVGFRVVAGAELRAGTNVNAQVPLAISPSFDAPLPAITNAAPLAFTALGGTGSNNWSLTDAALGSLSATSGVSVLYSALVFGNDTQTIFLTDGVFTTSAQVVQIDLGLPPGP